MKVFRSLESAELDRITSVFPSLRVAVVGDFFLDKYLDVDPALEELSIETGKAAHQVVRIRHSPGAAGTVANNVSALGVESLFAVGFTGDDGESYDLRRDLAEIGCDTDHLHIDPARKTPTYLKPRDQGVPGLDGEHSRYDTKNRTFTPAEIQRRIVASLDELMPRVDAVIITDQVEETGCGAITATVVEAIAARAVKNPRVVFWADSRRRIRDFRNVIIKPNQFEATGVVNPRPGQTVDAPVLEREIPTLRRLVRAPVFTTAGDRGIYVSGPELTLVRQFTWRERSIPPAPVTA